MLGVWAAVQGTHVVLRYASLGQLRFATLNQKRACALAAAHVAAVLAGRGGGISQDCTHALGSGAGSDASSGGGATGGGAPVVVGLPGVEQVNREEPMLLPATSVRPRLRLGCTLHEAWGMPAPGGAGGALDGADECALAEWVALYADAPYLLAWHDSAAWVVVKQGAAPRDLLPAVWQAAWLDAQLDGGSGSGPAELAHLRASLDAARHAAPGFAASLAAAGWDVGTQPVLQVAQTRLVVQKG